MKLLPAKQNSVTVDNLEPHPLAAIFPEIPSEELNQLARDIKERGQMDPIILYQGQILDGRNRYKACQLAGLRPWIFRSLAPQKPSATWRSLS